MQIPKTAKVYENTTSTFWFDKGILFVIGKKSEEISLEVNKTQTNALKEILQGKKVCAIIDINQTSNLSREAREYNSTQLPTMFTAIAFVTNTALGRMMSNLYLGLKPLPFPTKVFSEEKEARLWIEQFLDKN
ncbi:MAG: hypothetical protein JWO32_2337 [Bacteroidetes bacterium]|jgi:hypothetical protein|nr:hypothetical protein [Bacteroidota bacterium]